MITRQGRVEILNDPDCRLFPWHQRPVLELSESNAVQLHEGPCLVLFVGEIKGCLRSLQRSTRSLLTLHFPFLATMLIHHLSSLISLFLTSHLDAEEEGELEPAKELIQPIAEKIMTKYKAKEEEMPLLFFVAGEVCLPIYACNRTIR